MQTFSFFNIYSFYYLTRIKKESTQFFILFKKCKNKLLNKNP